MVRNAFGAVCTWRISVFAAPLLSLYGPEYALCVTGFVPWAIRRKGGIRLARNAGNGLGKVLALAGTVLVWLPILLTLLSSVLRLFLRRSLLLDVLMPAELFPLALVGALLLNWVAFREKSRLKSVVLSAAAMVVCFACVLAVPILTGLASGATPPEGWPMALSYLSLTLYVAAMALTGVMGALLTKDHFRKGGGSLS